MHLWNFHAQICSPKVGSNGNKPLTILVTGGKMAKSLLVTRCLWRQGHRVVLAETPRYWCSGARFSRSVWKFETISEDNYVQDVIDLVRKHNIDIFLPVQSPVAVFLDAEIKVYKM